MIDKTLTWIGWGSVLVILMTWVLPVTGLLFRPEHVEIVGDQVVLQRSFPGDRIGLPRPVMSYVETVKPLTPAHNGGHVCQHSSQAPFRYGSTEVVGKWSIDSAAACLTDPLGFTWDARWTAHVGVIPLGPVSKETTVLRDPCQYIVSTRGVVHGPDSPYHGTVVRSGSNCFPTQAAANVYVREVK
jgi:hypothetical protein